MSNELAGLQKEYEELLLQSQSLQHVLQGREERLRLLAAHMVDEDARQRKVVAEAGQSLQQQRSELATLEAGVEQLRAIVATLAHTAFNLAAKTQGA